MNIKHFLISSLKTLGVINIDYAPGVDLSHHDGDFDPDQATEEIVFGFMKLTEGTAWIDPKIELIWDGVKKLLVRGAYHYQRSGMSWQLQANHFMNQAIKKDFHFYILDVERWKRTDGSYDNAYNDTFFADTYRILEHWRESSKNIEVLLYTNIDTYQNYLYPSIKRQYGDAGVQWLKTVPFWIANPAVPGNPNMPSQRSDWDFHQYDWAGDPKKYGTLAYVDLNVYKGTTQQLLERVKVFDPGPIDPPPPPPPTGDIEPPTEGVPFIGRVNFGINSLNVRTLPYVKPEYKTNAQLSYGATLRGELWVGRVYLWMKITEAADPYLVGKWVAVRTLDNGYIFMTLYNVGNTPPPTQEHRNIFEVKPDQLMRSWDYQVRPIVIKTGLPMPAVNRTGEFEDNHNFDAATLSRQWQVFWADLLSMRKYGRLFSSLSGIQRDDIVRAFNSISHTKTAFNNIAGTDIKNNYVVGGEAATRGEDPKHWPLICGGSKVEVIETRMNSRGVLMARLNTFFDKDTPPKVTAEMLSDPRVLRAMNINKNGVLSDFDQLKDGKWCPYPYIAKSGTESWFPLEDLRSL